VHSRVLLDERGDRIALVGPQRYMIERSTLHATETRVNE
jgi:hypothetical protein